MLNDDWCIVILDLIHLVKVYISATFFLKNFFSSDSVHTHVFFFFFFYLFILYPFERKESCDIF